MGPQLAMITSVITRRRCAEGDKVGDDRRDVPLRHHRDHVRGILKMLNDNDTPLARRDAALVALLFAEPVSATTWRVRGPVAF